MQTKLIPLYQASDSGQEAESILRNCVHCGFCNATCPTYQVLGDELDGPRGRIYLIKDMLEGKAVTEETRTHLDRCLTCRACETTCPSGVEYHRLLDIGRGIIEETVPRSASEKVTRKLLGKLLSSPVLFKALLRLGQSMAPILPARVQAKVPRYQKASINTADTNNANVRRKVLLLDGCVQDALVPDINLATRKVLAHFSIAYERINSALCCGAVAFHLSEEERARQQARANIDAWWPTIEQNACEAILINASGCGVFVKDYQTLLKNDAAYAEKATRVSVLAKDPSEFLMHENWSNIASLNALSVEADIEIEAIAFHPPCTLQHGQKITGVVEKILADLGVKLVSFKDPHLCCGSAGTYSILQSDLSFELKSRKLSNLEAAKPAKILTANIGCQSHLATGTQVPVQHWLEFVAKFL